MCWCKHTQQCQSVPAPARDAAPALPLLCAHPRPKDAQGTHNRVIAPRQAVPPWVARFPLTWPPSSDVLSSIPPPVLPSIPLSLPLSIPPFIPPIRPSLLWSPSGAQGSALLRSQDGATSPGKQGFLGHPVQGWPRQCGLLEKLPLKTFNPRQGQRHPWLRWEGKFGEGAMEEVNLGPLAVP